MALPLPEATPVFVAPASWRAIDFISDLHLAESMPRVFAAWERHLLGTSADAVFILGDLFEVWVGDDAMSDFERRCVDVLARAAKRTAVAFMAGNRDFFVGDAMLGSAGVRRLADPTVVEAFGQRTLVSHGDALCLDDVAYQRYRSLVRRRFIRTLFFAMPASMRRGIAAGVRRSGSRARPDRPARMALDVDEATSLQWLRSANASTLVHGHTHAPATHAMGAGLVRHVLTDWDLDPGTPPRAEVLRWTSAGFARVAPESADRDPGTAT